MGDFRRFFMRGLAAIAPTLLTIALVTWAYRFIDQNIGRHITSLVVALYAWGGPPHESLGVDGPEAALNYGDPIDQWEKPDADGHGTGRRLTAQYKAIHDNPGLQHPDKTVQERAEKAKREALWQLATRRWPMFNAIGFVIAILLIYFMGHFLASFIGRRTWLVLERSLARIPFVGAIYPNIKQVTDFFISDSKARLKYSGVVAVQYPRKGLWALGLMTGAPMKAIAEADGRDMVTVFIPSSPTPITGYTITVSRDEILELPLTMDEAIRYTISGGVVKPGDAIARSPALPGEDGAAESADSGATS